MEHHSGGPTTGLLRAVTYLKDNRLLPRGFDRDAGGPDVAVRGEAETDADFVGGADRVRFMVDAGGATGELEVVAELWYQPVGFRWAQNLSLYDAPETRDRKQTIGGPMPSHQDDGPGDADRCHQSSGGGSRRSSLTRPRRRLASSRLRLSAAGTLVGTRGATRAFFLSSFLRSRRRAIALFRCWLRSFRAVARTPVGSCSSRTPLSVRFWCCPPFPPERNVSTRHWPSRALSLSGMGKGGDGSLISSYISCSVRSGAAPRATDGAG